MQADYSVELGRDDPALELPWSSADPAVCYFDLKASPELVHRIPEAASYPALRDFLVRVNAPDFPMLTAKCDVWQSRDILPEEEIFGAEFKFASYIDLAYTSQQFQNSFEKHEELVQDLCRLLKCAPELLASIDLVIRHCYYHDEDHHDEQHHDGGHHDEGHHDEGHHDEQHELPPAEADHADSRCGFSITAYVFGFGSSADGAVKISSIALNLLQHALIQASNRLSQSNTRDADRI
ncbi:MAG TPA: hypothetical protein VFT65_03575 [Candidatus Angelobacter sp.]|nr:hypothetical protein [Candidatus Angelobacter sp.]